jgi:predicted XRE-type DNA-binding protein
MSRASCVACACASATSCVFCAPAWALKNVSSATAWPSICVATSAAIWLAVEIFKIIKRRCLTQAAAGEILGINQPKVSALLNGRLDGFSTDRLFRFLNALGCDVRITVSPPRPRSRGKVRVTTG